jgi:hypothetical protein
MVPYRKESRRQSNIRDTVQKVLDCLTDLKY